MEMKIGIIIIDPCPHYYCTTTISCIITALNASLTTEIEPNKALEYSIIDEEESET